MFDHFLVILTWVIFVHVRAILGDPKQDSIGLFFLEEMSGQNGDGFGSKRKPLGTTGFGLVFRLYL